MMVSIELKDEYGIQSLSCLPNAPLVVEDRQSLLVSACLLHQSLSSYSLLPLSNAELASVAKKDTKPQAINVFSSAASATTFTFAENVTPSTYSDPSPPELPPLPTEPTPGHLFPVIADSPPPAAKKRRGKNKKDPDYVPRPANAFMLFRSDFIRRKHVPDGIETSQDTLSRIVSQCWHALPEDQKAPWKVKAEHEKAEHAKKYPGYVYRPNHSKDKDKDKTDKPSSTEKEKAPRPRLSVQEEERLRADQITKLLISGVRGEELATVAEQAGIRRAATRSSTPSTGKAGPSGSRGASARAVSRAPPRRSSSVPLPLPQTQNNGFTIELPSVHLHQPVPSPGANASVPTFAPDYSMSFVPQSNGHLAVGTQNDMMFAPMAIPRRPSTANMVLAQPTFTPDYAWNRMSVTQESWASFLPRRPSTVGAGASGYSGFRQTTNAPNPFAFHTSETDTSLFNQSFLNGGAFGAPSLDAFNPFDSNASAPSPHDIAISPLDTLDTRNANHYSPHAWNPTDPSTIHQLAYAESVASQSVPPSTYSGSPDSSNVSLPLFAPKPQHPVDPVLGLKGAGDSLSQYDETAQDVYDDYGSPHDTYIQDDYSPLHAIAQQFANGLGGGIGVGVGLIGGDDAMNAYTQGLRSLADYTMAPQTTSNANATATSASSITGPVESVPSEAAQYDYQTQPQSASYVTEQGPQQQLQYADQLQIQEQVPYSQVLEHESYPQVQDHQTYEYAIQNSVHAHGTGPEGVVGMSTGSGYDASPLQTSSYEGVQAAVISGYDASLADVQNHGHAGAYEAYGAEDTSAMASYGAAMSAVHAEGNGFEYQQHHHHHDVPSEY